MKFYDVHNCDGLCVVEYSGIGRPPTPWCKRFEDKIIYVGECWIWKAAKDKADSERNRLTFSLRCGKLSDVIGKYQMDACRWIYERVIGTISDELTIDHFECNNWRCVNPYHLEAVTNLENNSRYAQIRKTWTIFDSSGKFAGRSDVPIKHRFSQSDVDDMRAMRASGHSYVDIGYVYDITDSYASQIVRGVGPKYLNIKEVAQ